MCGFLEFFNGNLWYESKWAVIKQGCEYLKALNTRIQEFMVLII